VLPCGNARDGFRDQVRDLRDSTAFSRANHGSNQVRTGTAQLFATDSSTSDSEAAHSLPPSIIPTSCPDSLHTGSHFFVCCDMNHQSGPSPFQVLFESALRDYETQTGTSLANHPLSAQLQNCQSVESVIALLQEQARAFSTFRENDKIMKSLKSVVSTLWRVSETAALGQAIGIVCPRQPIRCSTSLTPIR
jgi:hypothetical protein